MTINIFIIHIFYLIYVAFICLGLSVFYSQMLTPKSNIAHPKKACFKLSLMLTAGTVFFIFSNSVWASLWFLISLALPAFLFFKDRPIIKTAVCLLVLLSYSFTEMAGFALLSIINLFFPQISLIPMKILLSGNLPLSFMAFALNVLIYMLLLFMLSKALKRLLAYLQPRTGILLALPFFIAIINVGVMTNIENHRDLFICTPALSISLAIALFILSKGLRELQRQEFLALQTEIQRQKIEYQLLYYKRMGEEFISLRKWKHDMANHISSITFLLENKNYKDAKKYLEELL